MATETTYTNLRAHLAAVLNRVVDDQEIFIVRRGSAPDVALIPAAELASLLETAHLLRSAKNAQRLLRTLHRSARGEGKPESVEKLRRELGLERRR